MMNDGTKPYIPDAETTSDKSNQALPGAHENSGCSYEFRYAEDREDVSVLNHVRVHSSRSKSPGLAARGRCLPVLAACARSRRSQPALAACGCTL